MLSERDWDNIEDSLSESIGYYENLAQAWSGRSNRGQQYQQDVESLTDTLHRVREARKQENVTV